MVKKMKAFKEIGFGLLTLIGIDSKVQSLFKILIDALFSPCMVSEKPLGPQEK